MFFGRHVLLSAFSLMPFVNAKEASLRGVTSLVPVQQQAGRSLQSETAVEIMQAKAACDDLEGQSRGVCVAFVRKECDVSGKPSCDTLSGIFEEAEGVSLYDYLAPCTTYQVEIYPNFILRATLNADTTHSPQSCTDSFTFTGAKLLDDTKRFRPFEFRGK